MYRTFGSILPVKETKNEINRLPKDRQFRTNVKPPKYFDSEALCEYYGPHKPIPSTVIIFFIFTF